MSAERDLIVRCLDALGQATKLKSYRLLAGGVSDVSTYLVELEEGSVVLKLAMEGDELSKARTLREIGFYKQLAPRVPLPTPPLLVSSADRGAPWLCLLAWNAAPPVAHWPRARYCHLASQLAQMHGAFLGCVDELRSLAWLTRRDQRTTPQVIETAKDKWRVVSESHARLFVCTTPSSIKGYLAQVGYLDDVIGESPATLVHGDCHHGNLLINPTGRWAWADWQEVGVGHGASDLSFFLQRAAMAGADVPEGDALSSYVESLAGHGRSSPSTAELARHVHAHELRMLLVGWPHYLPFVPPGSFRLALRRLEQLALQFGLD